MLRCEKLRRVSHFLFAFPFATFLIHKWLMVMGYDKEEATYILRWCWFRIANCESRLVRALEKRKARVLEASCFTTKSSTTQVMGCAQTMRMENKRKGIMFFEWNECMIFGVAKEDAKWKMDDVLGLVLVGSSEF